ncbi:hypothetical protein PV726_16775 [Streptomyces europaeiscabiei]|uniref:hypothetical protein n=1 Tax=Streptomyces europaeiscabiei TaxID=146819 RepID=UPI0029A9F8C7|nr:hypothetical protein [Streptomyces europaeiscabiei]MDX3691965.1 hypothetical protein [Streptomyces europaeiscabiei]
MSRLRACGWTWLRDCADGPPTDGDGSGNHIQWLWAGNAQHMTYAVRSLAGS